MRLGQKESTEHIYRPKPGLKYEQLTLALYYDCTTRDDLKGVSGETVVQRMTCGHPFSCMEGLAVWVVLLGLNIGKQACCLTS